MGGKRPDQYSIDPREAGASDYKTLPESGKHRGSIDETTVEDKRHLAEGMGHGGGPGQHFFDPAHKQPSHDSTVHAREGHLLAIVTGYGRISRDQDNPVPRAAPARAACPRHPAS